MDRLRLIQFGAAVADADGTVRGAWSFNLKCLDSRAMAMNWNAGPTRDPSSIFQAPRFDIDVARLQRACDGDFFGQFVPSLGQGVSDLVHLCWF